MPTTFDVFSLGNLADLDTVEGNFVSEGAANLVGLTFGGLGNPLFESAQTFSPGTGGFSGGTAAGYDQDNSPAENFRIDGGPDQVYDGLAIYNATLTYVDGSTATITAVVFQDTDGNTYLAPEFFDNPDQDALEAAPIRSLTLDSVAQNSTAGLGGDRQSFDFAACFTPGSPIETPSGPRPIETLAPGDLVLTLDRGARPVRWLGCSEHEAVGNLAPIRIRAGALGGGLPRHDLLVSRQHRMLLRSRVAARMFGTPEVFVPAIRLVDLPGISIEEAPGTRVTYIHLLLDRHEVLVSAGAPTESLLTDKMTLRALGSAAKRLRADCPEAMAGSVEPARPVAEGKKGRRLIERITRNGRPLIEPAADPKARIRAA